MAIVVLVLWIATAAAGLTLLRAGGARRRVAAEAELMTVPATAGTAPARIGAIPMTDDGRPPRGPRTRVVTPPGEHPLLEFAHPALAVAGVACWTMFTFVHYRAMAWIALGILLVTIALGLGWLVRSRADARRRAQPAWAFPQRLIALHGFAAACSIALTVLAALTASRG